MKLTEFFFHFICIAAFMLTSCKPKEEIAPEDPAPGNSTVEPVNVLNTNSGFSIIYENAQLLGGIYNQNSAGVYDFTLETNNRFNLAFYYEEATQQDPFRTQIRISKDLSTGQLTPVPGGAGQYTSSSAYGNLTLSQFFPYSNMLVKLRNYQSSTFGYNNSNTFFEDISAVAASPNPVGVGDLSFRYPVCNSGTGFGYYSKFSSVNVNPVVGSIYQVFNGAIGSQANLGYYKGGCIHEVYTGNGTYNFIAIGITSDSVKVYKLNYTSYGTATAYPTYSTSLISAIPTTINDFGTISKHYSSDGKTVCFMCSESNTNKVSTYIYNFDTNTLTQHLQQVTLEYAGSGSDIDLDEYGDVYYTGYANYGTNTNGVSVYKKSSSGASTLVGNDNILLYGTIVKLKSLMGKIYLAVTGKQTGKDVYQISIIKQN